MSHCRDYFEREPYTTPMPDVDQATIEALRNQRMNRENVLSEKLNLAINLLWHECLTHKPGCECEACKLVKAEMLR